MLALLIAGGLSRSLQFTTLNAVGYADVPPARLSNVSSFIAALQELSGSVGVTVAALALDTMLWRSGATTLSAEHFPAAILIAAGIAGLAVIAFTRLPRQAGSTLLKDATDLTSPPQNVDR
jgi:hypothetical protein